MSELLPAHINMQNLPYRVELFKAATTRQELAESLAYNYKFFVFFLYSQDVEHHYVEFNIAKGHKKVRLIAAPNQKLKQLQRNLASILLAIFKPKRCVHAFVENKNIVTNAQPHLRARHILRLDLKDFFPSIHFGRVRNLFEAKPFNFSREVSTTIAKICCYKGTLPQGSPVSPIISNMICLRMDAQLTRLAKDHACNYTRYADDITFSTNQEIFNEKIVSSTTPLVLADNLINIIERNNFFTINHYKTSIRSNNDSKFIAGIKVNTKINIARKKYREIRAMLHALETHGHDNALEEHILKYSRRKCYTPQRNFYKIIQGKIAFLAMVRGKVDPLVVKLQLQLEHIRELNGEKVNLRRIERLQSQIKDNFTLVLCEGKTDRIYLSFALRKLRSKGLFKDLHILFYVWTACEGYTAGKKDLQKIGEKGLLGRYSKNPKFYIFDRDIPSPNNYVRSTQQYEIPKYWGENTWSFLLHEPTFREGYGSSISIEHFFSDNIIFSPDAEGRRLYSFLEFSDKKLIKNPDICLKNSSEKKTYTLIDDGVMYNNKNIARSKFSLAKEIVKLDTISDDSLEEFKKISKVIERTIKNYT